MGSKKKWKFDLGDNLTAVVEVMDAGIEVRVQQRNATEDWYGNENSYSYVASFEVSGAALGNLLNAVVSQYSGVFGHGFRHFQRRQAAAGCPCAEMIIHAPSIEIQLSSASGSFFVDGVIDYIGPISLPADVVAALMTYFADINRFFPEFPKQIGDCSNMMLCRKESRTFKKKGRATVDLSAGVITPGAFGRPYPTHWGVTVAIRIDLTLSTPIDYLSYRTPKGDESNPILDPTAESEYPPEIRTASAALHTSANGDAALSQRAWRRLPNGDRPFV